MLLLSALLVNAAILVLGQVFDSIDLRTHYRWSYQFAAALAEGTLYPRWMPLANFGLGEPSFVIVHPGYYYVIAGLKACGLSIWDAMRATAVASSLLLGIAAYWVLRRTASAGWAWVGALALQASPFAMFLFGFHVALPWHFSLPLALLAIGLSLRERDESVSLMLALTIAGLCMTHLLVAFMVLVCVGLMKLAGLLWGAGDQGAVRLLGWIGSVSLGIGLAATYVLLAVTSGPLFSPEYGTDALYLNWRNSFILPVVTSRIFGVRWAVAQWVLPLVPLASLVVTGLILYRWRDARDGVWRMASRLAVVGALALVMASEVAYPLYAAIPFLTNVQWPYRFLTVASLAGGLALPLAGVIAFRAGGSRGLKLSVIGCFGLSFALFGAVQMKLVREGVDPQLGAATLVGNVAQRGAEPAAIGPRWRSYIDSGGFDGYCGREALRCEQVVQEAHRRVWRVTTESGGRVILPLFAFPAWTLYLDGARGAGGIDAETGLIVVDLPAGSHEIAVRWTGLWQEQAGLAISVGALALIIAIRIRRGRGARRAAG
ncbi:hypothetical protein [uncultured Thiodictyon sp.]|uniref:hypothetical protein n=1 Tax=uncultured Thiodictyon sp. TaxID=1846217 RepID=UPI0025DCCACB|nr:hypothetical protein [uncultured Thiodictyon sp.]